MSDLVGNPEDKFSYDAGQIEIGLKLKSVLYNLKDRKHHISTVRAKLKEIYVSLEKRDVSHLPNWSMMTILIMTHSDSTYDLE